MSQTTTAGHRRLRLTRCTALRAATFAAFAAFAACSGDDDASQDAATLDASVSDASSPPPDVAEPDDAGPADADVPPPALREALLDETHEVLFVGNSYLFTYDVPGRYRAIAEALPFTPLRIESVAFPGYRLEQHAADARTDGAPLAGWLRTGSDAERAFDVVVLQEQSQIGGLRETHAQRIASLDAASELASLVSANGSSVVLYMTWGREHGDPTNPGFGTFVDMQDRLDAGYRAMAARLRAEGSVVRIAPVGAAFRAVYDDVIASGADPLVEGSDFDALYEPDGSHPSTRGAYLAACVFAATISGVDPAVFPDDASLDASVSAGLRDIARRVALDPAWSDGD